MQRWRNANEKAANPNQLNEVQLEQEVKSVHTPDQRDEVWVEEERQILNKGFDLVINEEQEAVGQSMPRPKGSKTVEKTRDSAIPGTSKSSEHVAIPVSPKLSFEELLSDTVLSSNKDFGKKEKTEYG